MSEIHPYFTDKAREAFRRAGGDPDVSAEIAAWAQDARQRGAERDGIIVDQQGTIHAITRHTTSTTGAGARYIREAVSPAVMEQIGTVVDMGMAAMHRQAGPVIHLGYVELCTGAGRPGRDDAR